jgi:glycosyltransferase involved in cell wall biosynthesis
MLSGHGCVRVQKMAIPLLERGHEVHLIARTAPSYYEQYCTFTMAPTIRHYADWADAMVPQVDVFHAHNEPSWFVTLIKERCDVPVVLDVHDSYIARVTPEEAEKTEAPRIFTGERNNFQLADALVFPGRSFGKIVTEEYGLTQPQLILPSYVPKFLNQYNGGEWLGGLVYQGKMMLDSECVEGTANQGFRYCSYEELLRQAHEIGMDFHLYGIRSDEEYQEAYREAYLHLGRPYEDLLKSLTRHDWGLVGNVFPTPEWDVAFPNKLFEYIAASVPVVAMNAADCAEFIKEHGVGIVVDSIQELSERWSEHTEVRKSLIRGRQQFVMENHIGHLEELYEEAISG